MRGKDLHLYAYNVLMNLREQHPGFTFWFRQRGEDKFKQGYIFQGNEGYVFAGLYKRGGGTNMTRSVGIVFYPMPDGTVGIKLENAFNEEKDENILSFYTEMRDIVGDFRHMGGTNYQKVFTNPLKDLDSFLTDQKPRIDARLNERGLNDFIITEEAFKQRLETVIPYMNESAQISRHAGPAGMHLNTILYGPPGTGKTYNTINRALEILGVDVSGKSRKEIKEEFDNRFNAGDIAFTTFHQSMSYEDFIEGIKPETKDDKVLYHTKNGIFKTLSNRAFNNLVNSVSREKSPVSPTFDQLHNEFLDSIRESAGKEDYIFKTIYNHDIRLVEINGSTIVVMFRWQDVKKSIPATQRFAVSKEKLKLLFEGGVNPHKVKSLKQEFSPFMQHNLSVFYAVYRKFYDFITEQTQNPDLEKLELVEESDSEELLQTWASFPDEDRAVAIGNAARYVLIIDEINRGNVSQIFGELITLIEEDKRQGNKEAITVRLPYSKENFGVPPNLYILGTMNTADRSVEALDTALRRRFVFEEIMPGPQIIQEVFEKEFLDKCVEYNHLEWEDEDWLEIESAYSELLEEDAFKNFRAAVNLANNDKMTFDEYYSIWKNEDVRLKSVDILQRINDRIDILLGRDNMIGHAFFIGRYSWISLQKVFSKNIVPLLQEYFYGDYGKIGLVLGEGFFDTIREEQIKNPFATFGSYDPSIFLEKQKYGLKNISSMSKEEFIAAIQILLNGR